VHRGIFAIVAAGAVVAESGAVSAVIAIAVIAVAIVVVIAEPAFDLLAGALEEAAVVVCAARVAATPVTRVPVVAAAVGVVPIIRHRRLSKAIGRVAGMPAASWNKKRMEEGARSGGCECRSPVRNRAETSDCARRKAPLLEPPHARPDPIGPAARLGAGL
jgi:hypothetical protein